MAWCYNVGRWSDGSSLGQTYWAPEYPKTDSVGWLCGYTNGEDPSGIYTCSPGQSMPYINYLK